MRNRNDWAALNRKTVLAAWHMLAHRLGLIGGVPAESCEWLQRRELMRSLDVPDEQPPYEEPEDDDS